MAPLRLSLRIVSLKGSQKLVSKEKSVVLCELAIMVARKMYL